MSAVHEAEVEVAQQPTDKSNQSAPKEDNKEVYQCGRKVTGVERGIGDHEIGECVKKDNSHAVVQQRLAKNYNVKSRRARHTEIVQYRQGCDWIY